MLWDAADLVFYLQWMCCRSIRRNFSWSTEGIRRLGRMTGKPEVIGSLSGTRINKLKILNRNVILRSGGR
jgi:hypothetical protein